MRTIVRPGPELSKNIEVLALAKHRSFSAVCNALMELGFEAFMNGENLPLAIDKRRASNETVCLAKPTQLHDVPRQRGT